MAAYGDAAGRDSVCKPDSSEGLSPTLAIQRLHGATLTGSLLLVAVDSHPGASRSLASKTQASGGGANKMSVKAVSTRDGLVGAQPAPEAALPWEVVHPSCVSPVKAGDLGSTAQQRAEGTGGPGAGGECPASPRRPRCRAMWTLACVMRVGPLLGMCRPSGA